MRSGCYYLNNSGSRWVVYRNGLKEKITLATVSGRKVTRTALFYESFGNFASVFISYKGRKISVLADSILPD